MTIELLPDGAARKLVIETCLVYLRQAVTNPQAVPPWSEWWAAHGATVQRVFPLIDFVRLKHRRLLGARQMLIIAGELPADFVPPDPRVTGSCIMCGERTIREVESIRCPHCLAQTPIDPALAG